MDLCVGIGTRQNLGCALQTLVVKIQACMIASVFQLRPHRIPTDVLYFPSGLRGPGVFGGIRVFLATLHARQHSRRLVHSCGGEIRQPHIHGFVVGPGTRSTLLGFQKEAWSQGRLGSRQEKVPGGGSFVVECSQARGLGSQRYGQATGAQGRLCADLSAHTPRLHLSIVLVALQFAHDLFGMSCSSR